MYNDIRIYEQIVSLDHQYLFADVDLQYNILIIKVLFCIFAFAKYRIFYFYKGDVVYDKT